MTATFKTLFISDTEEPRSLQEHIKYIQGYLNDLPEDTRKLATENTIKDSFMAFAEFKAFQDLSYKDVCELFGCSMEKAKKWTKDGAPAEINYIAMIANKAAERARLRGMKEALEQEVINARKKTG